MLLTLGLNSGCVSTKQSAYTETPYSCVYPSEVDVMPVGTVKITEYSQTGITEAYIQSNALLDIANKRLISVGDFIRQAKQKEAQSKGVDKL